MSKQHRTLKIVAVAAAFAVAAVVGGSAIGAQAPGRRGDPGMERVDPGPGMPGQGRMMGPGGMMGRGGGRFGGPMGFGPGMLDPRFARALDLTEAQRQEIRMVAESHRDEMRVLAERAQPIRQMLQDAVLAGDPAAIDALAPDLGQLQADEAKLRARVHAEIVAKLTAEQQEKIKTFQEQMRTRRQDAQAGPPRGRR